MRAYIYGYMLWKGDLLLADFFLKLKKIHEEGTFFHFLGGLLGKFWQEWVFLCVHDILISNITLEWMNKKIMILKFVTQLTTTNKVNSYFLIYHI